MIDCIKTGNIIEIESYISFLTENTYQVFLVEEYNNILNARGLKDKMPLDWNWKDPNNNNVFQRYIDAGIPRSEYQ